MNRPAHILASIVTAAVLAATPAIATLCAMLCSPAATATVATAEPAHHDHEHHSAEAMDVAGAPMAGAAVPAADARHRHAAEPRTHHGSGPAQLTAQSSHPCCDGESMAPRALTTRRVDSGATSAPPAGVAAPLVSFTTVPLAHAPAARTDAHPVSRPPLVLRI